MASTKYLPYCAICRISFNSFDTVESEYGVILQRDYHPVSFTDSSEVLLAYHTCCRRMFTDESEASQAASLLQPVERFLLTAAQSRRLKLARQHVAQALGGFAVGSRSVKGVAAALPMEIRMEIAQYLTLEFLAALATRALRRSAGYIDVDAERLIYLRREEFEGSWYVYDISNSRLKGTAVETLDAPSSGRGNLYYCWDLNGVLDIRFLESTQEAPVVERAPGRWWTCLELDKGSKLNCLVQGVTVKNIGLLAADDHILLPEPSWSIPRHPASEFRLESLQHHVSMQLDMYFDYVELNRSDITAYSARCEYWIAPIVANYAGEAYGVTDYDDHDGPYWVHFPVRDGEKIAEIWRRKHHGFRTNTLAMKTTFGRTFVFGPHISPGKPSWMLLAQIQPQPTRFWLEASHGQIMAFDSTQPDAVDQTLSLPDRPTRLQKPLPADSFHFQEAEMSGLRSVRPCRYGDAMSGLLIEYHDGHKETVGMVHLKNLEPPIVMDGTPRFWLGFALREGRFCYVCDATAEKKPDKAENRICVSGSGLLQWWTSWRQCQVVFGDQKSPELWLD